MLGCVLLIFGFLKKGTISCWGIGGGEHKISALSDVLLVQILSLVPTKGCSGYHVFVGLIGDEPTSLPESLYICDTLVYLRLSGKVSVDVSSPVCLPSLKHLYLALYPDDKFMRCLSSLRYLEICCVLWACGIIFSQLIECKIRPCVLDWFEPLLLLLQNSPNLKVLVIDQVYYQTEPFPLSWNQPSYVPLCLSTSLEIFEWNKFRGKPEEMEIVRYIFANSKCRKRAGISLNSIFWGRKDIMIELAHMPEITSTSSKLHFYTQLKVNH
ncbi:F-box/FBD/LRR-repeat protein At4g26340 [Eutrema salsugineum]|uniref:F-box/FBD/LRR-repeat protein At4g26340 n=1 Tax=Eutrema salsugineum TaxID=72664 RepID=UPI000CED4645|nr:F-box/FBD/LRR-repeat protein At4g26340 [Eutrema salsugineum]